MISTLLALFGLHFGGNSEAELQDLHTEALHAYHAKDYTAAHDAYEKIIDKVSPPHRNDSGIKCDWQTYIDIITRYAEIELNLGNPSSSQTLLRALLLTNPPSTFIPSITILLAKATSALGQTEQAFIHLKEVEKIQPLHTWRGEDRLFYHSIEYLLNDRNDRHLMQAKAYCLAGQYVEGAKIYEYILDQIDQGTYPKASLDSILAKKVRYRLAESHFHAANFDKTITLTQGCKEPETKIDAQMLYLSAIAYKEKNDYEKAIDCFYAYINAAKPADLALLNEALYEIGRSLYQNKQWEKAKSYFERILQSESLKKVYFLSSIYLAKIHLQQESYSQAEELLSNISKKIDKHNPLLFEINYLRGECYFGLHQFANAISIFEKCQTLKNMKSSWSEALCFKLALCHMHLGSAENTPQEERRKHFDSAKAILVNLHPQKDKPSENFYLYLAHLVLLEKKFFQNDNSITEVEEMLNSESTSFSNSAKVEALLALSLMQPTLEKQGEILKEACSEKYAGTPLYPEVWMQKACNEFHLASNAVEKEKSIASFEKAFSLLEKNNMSKSETALTVEAIANLYKVAPNLASQTLDKLLGDFSISDDKKQEALYLKGLISLHLKQEDKAEEAFSKVSSPSSGTKYSDAGLYALATLYFQRGDFANAAANYDALFTRFPESKHAGDALYWSAEALELQRGDLSEIVKRRKLCYQNYPHSSHASHSYFKCNTTEEYFQGKEGSITFLKDFPEKFPNSPLLIACYYFLGAHENDFALSKSYFEKAIQTFNSFYGVGETDLTSLIYFRYRSMLELAYLYMERSIEAEHLQAAYLIHSITEEFEDEKHPLSSACNHPELNEESRFALGKCYILLGKADKGKEIFFKMLAQYDKAGIKKAYYLSKIWQTQAELAIEMKDTTAAIKCLEMAAECGEGHLSPDERLGIWIQISEVWRVERKFDLSMRMLSKVINEDVVSPLRLKAMYLRAEIYELEGRPELAIRQLEAIAKKEGTWANLAQDKLKNTYGIE